MDFVLKEKIRVGISACNAGARVRWNRAGWDRLGPLDRERNAFIWTPVCPEVMAGLGVPRNPIRLSGGNGDDFWKGQAGVKDRSGNDVSQMIRKGSEACLQTLERSGVEAFVFMEGSPSCGVYRTTLKNTRLGKPPGVFGSRLLSLDLFLIPALDLESPVKWWDWRRRLHAFCWLKRQEIESKHELYQVWHHFKFLCQEIDQKRSREIGTELAGLSGKLSPDVIASWKSELLRLLRRPSTLKRINASMLKHYAYYRREKDGETGTSEDMPTVPDMERSKHRYAEELIKMENRAYQEGIVFAGTPVLFRGDR